MAVNKMNSNQVIKLTKYIGKEAELLLQKDSRFIVRDIEKIGSDFKATLEMIK